jgi:hypothetical protein
MVRIFPQRILANGDIPVISRRFTDGATQLRRIKLQEKNWRLVGDVVSGAGLELVDVGDFFWAYVDGSGELPIALVWDVVTRPGDGQLHKQIEELDIALQGGMTSWSSDHPAAGRIAAILCARRSDPEGAFTELRVEASKARDWHATQGLHLESVGADYRTGTGGTRDQEVPTSSTATSQAHARPKRKRIEEKLRRPHILTEILKSGMALSAAAQADFIDVLDTLSAELRQLLLEASFIGRVEINHRKVWDDVRGVPVGFIDGGVANVTSIGSAPVAIRVGSYVVVPGEKGSQREHFDFEIQLVDELYETTSSGAGIYEDFFEDVAKLRDAARIACELAGMVSMSRRSEPPRVLVLHGPLVNPVSPYALGLPGQPGAFPNFTTETIRKLLPGDEKRREAKQANFVAVYLDQLRILSSCPGAVCGVVERPSSASPGPLIEEFVRRLHDERRIDAQTRREFVEKMQGYRITDSIIFECVLDEGEYVEPIELNKQGPDHKIPNAWFAEITSYPKPLTTYVKSSAETMPVRVESFPTSALAYPKLMSLIVHMSRLLPRYSFPVGLDIVDKHAKIPEWMSRQMNAMLSAQLMRKAMDTGNPAAIRMVRRILSANMRDWLFRPDFRKG